MGYLSVRGLYESRRDKTSLGDIVLLNRCLAEEAENGHTTGPDDVEALLFDCCPEYSTYTAQERREILAHSAARGRKQ